MTKEELQSIATLLDEKLAPIQKDISELKIDVRKLEVKIENETDRTIKVLGEGHSILNRKLDEKISLENRVETVENKVSAIEYTMKKAE